MITPQHRVKKLMSWEAANDFRTVDLVKEWANCRSADVNIYGDIWIADPQAQHYLDEDKLTEFCDWVDSRSQ